MIARRTLQAFWETQEGRASKQPLLAWFDEVKKDRWFTPADIKKKYGSADFVANNRVIFNIGGNKFRLVVAVRYARTTASSVAEGCLFIRFVGTHRDYDRIDPASC